MIENRLKERLVELINTAVSMGELTSKKVSTSQKILEEVISEKKKNSTLEFGEVKERLSKYRQEFFICNMLNQNVGTILLKISEIYNILVISKVDISFTESQSKFMDKFIIGKKSELFTVKGDKLIILDQVYYDITMKTLNEKDAELVELFNSL